jgi:hypothetical protein
MEAQRQPEAAGPARAFESQGQRGHSNSGGRAPSSGNSWPHTHCTTRRRKLASEAGRACARSSAGGRAAPAAPVHSCRRPVAPAPDAGRDCAGGRLRPLTGRQAGAPLPPPLTRRREQREAGTGEAVGDGSGILMEPEGFSAKRWATVDLGCLCVRSDGRGLRTTWPRSLRSVLFRNRKEEMTLPRPTPIATAPSPRPSLSAVFHSWSEMFGQSFNLVACVIWIYELSNAHPPS